MIFSTESPPERIYLIGFMGSGKTFLGKKLAAQLGWDFLDLDETVERGAGMAIADIFKKMGGEPHFRLLEQAALRSTFLLKKTVVATGGGAPCFFENMDEMQQNGLVIFLSTSQNLLFERLSRERSNRPLIAEKGEGQLRHFIKTMILARKRDYLRASLTITQRKNEPEIIGKMLKKLRPCGLGTP